MAVNNRYSIAYGTFGLRVVHRLLNQQNPILGGRLFWDRPLTTFGSK